MYKITIVKIETKEFRTREWERQYDDNPFSKIYSEDSQAKQYAYVETTVNREVETILLQQTVDKLPMENVIKAINSID